MSVFTQPNEYEGAPALITTLSTHGHSTPAILRISIIGTIYLPALLNGCTKVVHTESVPYIMRVNRKLKASNTDISAQLDSKLGLKFLLDDLVLFYKGHTTPTFCSKPLSTRWLDTNCKSIAVF